MEFVGSVGLIFPLGLPYSGPFLSANLLCCRSPLCPGHTGLLAVVQTCIPPFSLVHHVLPVCSTPWIFVWVPFLSIHVSCSYFTSPEKTSKVTVPRVSHLGCSCLLTLPYILHTLFSIWNDITLLPAYSFVCFGLLLLKCPVLENKASSQVLVIIIY